MKVNFNLWILNYAFEKSRLIKDFGSHRRPRKASQKIWLIIPFVLFVIKTVWLFMMNRRLSFRGGDFLIKPVPRNNPQL